MSKLNTFHTINVNLCTYFLQTNVGDKILSVDKLMKIYKVGRGTIQNVISYLEGEKAIVLQKNGRDGTVLLVKNENILLHECGVIYFNGIMPMPYTKKYEGLASALNVFYSTKYNLNFFMSFTSSSKDRIHMLKIGACSFAVVSLKYANKLVEEDNTLKIAYTLGEKSYTNEHGIISLGDYTDKDVINVGIDNSSDDHILLINSYFNDSKYKFVNVRYNSLLEQLDSNNIDVTIMNLDMKFDSKYMCTSLEKDYDLNTAAIVCKTDSIFASVIPTQKEIEDIIFYQKNVENENVLPNY